MRPTTLVLLAALASTALPAAADEMERVPPVTHAPTLKECGECHMAFPPALLPAESWRKLMAGLSDHFGEDASLEPALAAEIERYLMANAGRRGDGSLIRISDQRWFRYEHDFAASVWKRPEIRSPANCEACHKEAARGWFEDD
jgi:hypothetical protein